MTRINQECCPEPAAVTLVDETINITPAGALNVALSAGTATAKTLTVSVLDTDGDVVLEAFEFTIRLVDNPNLTDEATGAPPPTPGWPQAVKHTDPATGLCTVDFENTGANRDWYIIVSWAGAVADPVVLNLGV